MFKCWLKLGMLLQILNKQCTISIFEIEKCLALLKLQIEVVNCSIKFSKHVLAISYFFIAYCRTVLRSACEKLPSPGHL